MPRRRASRKMSRSSVTASRSKLRSRAYVTASRALSSGKRGQRDRFRSGKGRIPSCAMLDRRDGLSVRAFVLLHYAMPDKLLAGVRMLAFRQPGKLICVHGPREAELLGQPAVPFSQDRVALFPIVLLGRRELFGVVGLRLA